MDVEELKPLFEKYRVSKTYVDELKKKGIKSIDELVMLSRENLMFLLGVNEETADKIISLSWKMYKPTFKTASELKVEEEKIEKIESPLPTLNDFLGGGFEVGSLIELFGSFASGKTQFLLTQSVLEASKGHTVLFIDTEGTFRYDRLEQIALARNVPVEKLNNIFVKKAPSSNEIEILVHNLFSIVSKFIDAGMRITLIAIDSIMNPFRADYVGISRLAERQQHLNWCLRTLLKIAETNKLVVMYSNQVVGSPRSYAEFIPAGGHILAHTSTIRFGLYKRGDYRLMRVEDAPNLPKYEIWFKITEKGVEEAKKKGKKEEE